MDNKPVVMERLVIVILLALAINVVDTASVIEERGELMELNWNGLDKKQWSSCSDTFVFIPLLFWSIRITSFFLGKKQRV